MNTVLFEFSVDFRVSGGAFGSVLGIVSGMGAKVKTVLAHSQELDFQGSWGVGIVSFCRVRRFKGIQKITNGSNEAWISTDV